MARTMWSGSLSFGLVNVPVQMVSAARDLDLHFHQLHEKDKTRIEQRRFCSKEDEEVPWEEIGREAETKRGKKVVLTDEELASVQPRKTRTIEIESFAELEQIDPIYFASPYLLLPAGESEGTIRAYKLLIAVMEQESRAAIGRFVMRNKEYLAALLVRDGALALTTMRFGDEVRATDGIAPGGRRLRNKSVDNAVAIIGELSTDWDPASYTDCYRERLERVIAKKRKGGKIEAPEQESEPKPAPDLMAALEQTLKAVKSGSSAADARRAASGDARGLAELSKQELLERAKEAGVEGRSKMGKQDLAEALADEG
jgi:DNA end-binding protein Ku